MPTYQFGSYTYPKSTIFETPDEMSVRERLGETPGRHGGYSQGGLLGPKRITISGHLVPDAADDPRALWDDFKAAHQPGRKLELFTGDSDRSILAEVVALKDMDAGRYVRSFPWEVSFLCSTPFFQEYPSPADASLAATGGTVALAGNASAPPVISLTFSAQGSAGATITITNTTTGKSFVLKPGANASPVVDCAAHRVTQGSTDVTSIFTSGTFFDLAPGNNTITVATTSGLTVAASGGLVVARRGRWW